MPRVVWTDPALDNLDAIRRYLKQFNPYAAASVAEEIIATGNGLANFPHRGRTVRGTTLREAATTYPYIIRYRINGDEVIILRVRHTARRPTNP